MQFLLPLTRLGPLPWAGLWRDRLQAFRGLFLSVALFVYTGLTLAIAPARATSMIALLIGIGGVGALTAHWLTGLRRKRFPIWTLPLEIGLVVVTTGVLVDEVAALGMCYIAIQFRALFGDRRSATVMTVGYILAYLIGLSRLPHVATISAFVVVIEVGVLALCGFLMHSLAEVFARDEASKQALLASEQRFRAVVENLREALIITDLDDRIVLANGRVREVLGYAPEELVGRIAATVLLPAAVASAFRDRIAHRRDGVSELYELELVRKDGRVMIAEISASPYRDAKGEVVGTLGAISDVTEQKRMEERLRHARRLEAVGQLAGGIAHDFNNLLTVIRCHAALLGEEPGIAAGARQSVAEIDHAADRGATLTRQLLAFSRQQLLQPKRIAFADVVSRAMPMLRRLVRDEIILEDASDADTRRSRVYADPFQLEQVLVTLVRNASDAIAGPGRITIVTGCEDLTDARSLPGMADAAPGRYAVLAVSDTGSGMTPEVTARLFEPFFTTRPVGEGTGLGLASAYGIVRQSGGFIDVKTSPGAGATFRVFLPCALESLTQPTPSEDHRAA